VDERFQETLPLQGGSVILRTEPGVDTDRDGRLLRYVQAVIGGGQIGDCGLYRYDHTGVYQGGDDASGEYVQQLYGADLTFAASPPSGRECGQDPPSAYVPAPDPDVYVDTDDDDDHHDGGESRFCRDYWSGKQRAKYLGLSTLVAALSATLFIVVGGLLGVSGWRAPFWLYLAPLLFVVPMAKLLWQPSRSSAHATGARLEPLPAT
jgi:hypothetical protein